MFDHMFHLTLPVAEKVLRPILVYAFLVVALRIFGKRELAQSNPFDFVVLMSLANTVQNAIIGDDNTVSGGALGAFSLLAINYLMARFLFKHRRIDQILEGKPTVIIEKGKILREALAKELLAECDLKSAAHRQGFTNLAEIEHGELEPGGTFFLKRKEPGVGETRHAQLMDEIRGLRREVAELRKAG